MRQHVEIGAEILEVDAGRWPFAAPAVRASHEWFGGGGYPRTCAGARHSARQPDHRGRRRLRRDDPGPRLPDAPRLRRRRRGNPALHARRSSIRRSSRRSSPSSAATNPSVPSPQSLPWDRPRPTSGHFCPRIRALCVDVTLCGIMTYSSQRGWRGVCPYESAIVFPKLSV